MRTGGRLAVAAALWLWSLPALAAPLKVVTTFTVLADMVRQVGGENVEVVSLVGPDGDAHAFEPSPADARAVAGAGLLVVNGLGYEGWLDRLGAASGFKGRTVVATTGVTALTRTEDGKTVPDPHAWQDAAQGRIYVANIAAGLEAADPAHAAAYRVGADRYGAELAALDDWVRAQIATVPPARRQVITSHDAVGYFGRAYGVTFLAPQGIDTEAEVSARDLGRLVGQIRRTGIKAIFLENMSDPRLVRQLASETGVKVGGTLYVDALSPSDGPAPTYVAMFRHNVPELVAAMRTNQP